jgi:hypothetical protein
MALNHGSFGKVSSLLLGMALAVPFLLEPTQLLTADELESWKANCRNYAQQAKGQVEKYAELKCTDKENSAQWALKEEDHYGWCILEPVGSKAPLAGLRSRREFLSTCSTNAAEGAAPDGGSRPEVDFKCPADFPGPYTFRDDQITSYYHAPETGSDSASVACDYTFEGGTIRLYAQWTEGYVEWPVARPDPPKGCGAASGLAAERDVERGRVWISPSFRALGGVSGEGFTEEGWKIAIAMAKAALGPLNSISIFAETRARPCH